MAIEASRRSLSPPTLDRLLAHWALLATYGRADEAMAEVERRRPELRDHPSVLHFRGTIASEQGRFAEAKTLLRRALATRPIRAELVCTGDDQDVHTRRSRPRRDAALPTNRRARRPMSMRGYCYASARPGTTAAKPARAFCHYERGAALRKPAHPYDPTAEAAAAERTIGASQKSCSCGCPVARAGKAAPCSSPGCRDPAPPWPSRSSPPIPASAAAKKLNLFRPR